MARSAAGAREKFKVRPSGAGGGREGFAPLGRAVIGVEGVLLGSNRNSL